MLRRLLASLVVANAWWSSECRSEEPSALTAPATAPAAVSTQPARPRTTEFKAARQRLADTLAREGIVDARVLQAMRDVPRHWFVPADLVGRAYENRPLPIGHEQTISQPYIVAIMTELLDVRAGDKVLEIGTGSGYQAAVLAELTPNVFTIEIVEPLARRTMTLLKQKGYDTIRVRVGDGFAGWPEEAPFDGIIITCAAPRPPAPLIEQLAVGGRLVMPLGQERMGQDLVVFTKRPDGSLDRRTALPVIFVPMTGEIRRARP